jgi:hypothetical protein
MPEDKSYNVVFRNIVAESGYAGIITWTSFKDKAAFDAWFTPKLRGWYEVVAEGVTSEQAVELTHTTPAASRLRAARAAATDKDGNIHEGVYQYQLTNAMFAMGQDFAARRRKLEAELDRLLRR